MYRGVVRSVWAVLAVTVLVLSAQGVAFATVGTAPEIDGSVVAPALGMLAAGVMMLKARARK